MNEKFFDLAKEKQDRMINGALQVFGEKGYQHASTDDMVKVAGISKGLWFHYFGSKLGLYEFVYEYSIRYLVMELTTVVNNKEKDYFEVLNQMLTTLVRVMKTYPYLPLFIHKAYTEEDLDAIAVSMLGKDKLKDRLNTYLRGADLNGIEDRTERVYLRKIVRLTLEGILLESYRNYALDDEVEPARMYDEMKKCLAKLKHYFVAEHREGAAQADDSINTVA